MTTKLQTLRESKGWNKSELGRHLCVQQGVIGRIETGRFIPYQLQLEKQAEALDYGASQLRCLNLPMRMGRRCSHGISDIPLFLDVSQYAELVHQCPGSIRRGIKKRLHSDRQGEWSLAYLP